ncbi:MAG: hypothetical protein H0T98_06275 [Euzebyaceae bacterium]|nr:hypothetical protein [Euzebyaceae bacterium]
MTDWAERTKGKAPDLSWTRLLALAAAGGAALAIFSSLGDGIIRVRLLTVLGNLGSPWGLAAFGLGLVTTSRLRGSVAATLLLLIASAIYALPLILGGHGVGSTTLQWAVVALLVGPVMGYCGAAVAGSRRRPPILAVAAPSTMLVAEAVFFLWERRFWLWNLRAEPYRLVDLGIALGFIALALWLPLLLAQGRRRLIKIYVMALGGGSLAAAGLLEIYRLVLSGR